MKLQDIIFLIIFAFLLWQRKPLWLIAAGLLCLLFAISLFAMHIFFTAERLIEYAFFLLLAANVLLVVRKSIDMQK